MDRRAFIKSLGVMASLHMVNVYGGSRIDVLGKEHQGGNQFPEIRVIAVGNGGWELLKNHYFSSSMHPNLYLTPEQILFIGRTGRLFQGPRAEDQDSLWRDFSSEGEQCEREINRLAYFKEVIGRARAEIIRFIKPSDLVVLVASLDNGMAFVACDEVSQLCRTVGANVIGLVATPYSDLYEDRARGDKLSNASDAVVKQIIKDGHPTFLDAGYWASEPPLPLSWSWYGQDVALGMITQVSRSHQASIFSKMIEGSSRLHCTFGLGFSAVEAIQDAIDLNSGWSSLDDGRTMTAAGAVIRVSGHPDLVEAMRTDVLSQLQQPDQFIKNAQPYWRKDAQFHVTVKPDEQWHDHMFNLPRGRECYYLDVLSTGIEIV